MVARDGDGFCFALPPSLGQVPVRDLARRLADVLYGIGFSTVVPMTSYEQLERALLSGEVDAAWGPPIVCARVEDAGGLAALRSVRYGAVTYRSVVLCRTGDRLDLRHLELRQLEPSANAARPVRAAWVDPRSMGGYILARHHLRSRGIEPRRAFVHEKMLGSYAACFQAVLSGEADVTASYASRRGLGYVELLGEHAFELRVLAYTGECPNDALVLSPQLSAADAATLVGGLRRLVAHPASLALLASLFGVDNFDRPPAATYSPLLSLLEAS